MAVKKTKTLPIAQKVTEEVPVKKDSMFLRIEDLMLSLAAKHFV